MLHRNLQEAPIQRVRQSTKPESLHHYTRRPWPEHFAQPSAIDPFTLVRFSLEHFVLDRPFYTANLPRAFHSGIRARCSQAFFFQRFAPERFTPDPRANRPQVSPSNVSSSSVSLLREVGWMPPGLAHPWASHSTPREAGQLGQRRTADLQMSSPPAAGKLGQRPRADLQMSSPREAAS